MQYHDTHTPGAASKKKRRIHIAKAVLGTGLQQHRARLRAAPRLPWHGNDLAADAASGPVLAQTPGTSAVAQGLAAAEDPARPSGLSTTSATVALEPPVSHLAPTLRCVSVRETVVEYLPVREAVTRTTPPCATGLLHVLAESGHLQCLRPGGLLTTLSTTVACEHLLQQIVKKAVYASSHSSSVLVRGGTLKPAPKSSRSSDTSKILLPRANHDAFKETSKNRLMWVVAVRDLRAALQKEELGDLQALGHWAWTTAEGKPDHGHSSAALPAGGCLPRVVAG